MANLMDLSRIMGGHGEGRGNGGRERVNGRKRVVKYGGNGSD